MSGMALGVPDRAVDDDLPLYLVEERPGRTRRDRAATGGDVRAVLAAVVDAVRPAAMAPCFSRLIALPGDALPAVLDAWWAQASRDGTAVLGERLVVQLPRKVLDTWCLDGVLTPGRGARRLPVEVELWTHASHFTRVTMEPRAKVVGTSRYFRAGHCVLDQLDRELRAVAARRSCPVRPAGRDGPDRPRTWRASTAPGRGWSWTPEPG